MAARFVLLTAILLVLEGCSPATGIYHPVGKGQTLYRISRVYGVEETYLARINGIDDPRRLEAGRKIFIPGATEVKPVVVARAGASSPKMTGAPKPAPPSSGPGRRLSSPPPTAKEASPPAPPPSKGRFEWPLRGKIVRDFGTSQRGTSRGIEISAPSGTPVLAAAAGKVTYSGNGIRGYGNLIIVKHADAFYTIYGFNRENLVAAGSFVGKGERIARVGTPPGSSDSRLHFELRHGKDAVNPIFYLP